MSPIAENGAGQSVAWTQRDFEYGFNGGSRRRASGGGVGAMANCCALSSSKSYSSIGSRASGEESGEESLISGGGGDAGAGGIPVAWKPPAPVKPPRFYTARERIYQAHLYGRSKSHSDLVNEAHKK